MVARVGILFCLAALTGLGLAQLPGNAIYGDDMIEKMKKGDDEDT